MATLAPSSTIYVYGLPSLTIGGAATELWHTLKLWRALGLPVAVFPHPAADAEQCDRLRSIGCELVDIGIPDRSIVVGFCNSIFRRDAADLAHRDCRLVYVPCMTWQGPDERTLPRFIDRYVFQSNYQQSKLLSKLHRQGFDPANCRLIRGAFDATEFPYKPLWHNEGEPFVIGRLSRAYGQPGNVPALDKFPADLWKQYQRIPHAGQQLHRPAGRALPGNFIGPVMAPAPLRLPRQRVHVLG
jgi:hypothetical protein